MRSIEDCTGCGACVQICPDGFCRFYSDGQGFSYPTCDGCSKKNSCHLCDDVCPRVPVEKTERSKIIACRAKNERLIMKGSSSGAIFQVLANHVIDNDGVVFGASISNNFNITHKFARTKEELKDLLGSKYVQSDICLAYKQAREYIRKGKLVLFSGTPCQIAGLRSFLGDKLSRSTNLVSIDLICHGVASPGIWMDYIAEQKTNESSLGKLRKISFRHKEPNHKNEYNFHYVFRKKTFTRNASKDGFYQQFFKNFILRRSCYHCDFRGLNRSWADISLGDFPIPDRLVPDIYSPYGTSIVLSHSDKGNDYLKKIGNFLVYKEIGDEKMINSIFEINTAIVASHKKPKDYDRFWNEYEARGYNASCVIAFPISRKKTNKIRSCVRKFAKFIIRMAGLHRK